MRAGFVRAGLARARGRGVGLGAGLGEGFGAAGFNGAGAAGVVGNDVGIAVVVVSVDARRGSAARFISSSSDMTSVGSSGTCLFYPALHVPNSER